MAKDNDLDDFDLVVTRYRPEGLDTLVKSTKFTKKELQIMYRGFKQECPMGQIDVAKFAAVFDDFFVFGDSTAYAHYVFNTFDADRSGTITFEEFVIGLSVISRGSLQEKLEWAFRLYDINGDGMITKGEMTDIVSAIYSLMGKYADPVIDEQTPREHVEVVFEKMDLNGDGLITMDEFMTTCGKDEMITQSMAVLDTTI